MTPGGEREFRAFCTEMGIEPESLVVGPSGTLAVDAKGDAGAAPLDVSELPLVVLDPGVAAEGRLRLSIGDTLSKGGMGVVHRASQPGLERSIAIKSVRGPDGAPRADEVAALWREAIATGALDHPNIIPVHVFGRTEEGDPVLVMKLIEGKTWHDELEARDSVDDDLAKHLDVLLQVSRAVHSAHERGVLHRDVKPRNVMIGNYGEVYLVDWGLAVTTNPKRHAKIRPATDVVPMEGTPGYLAPEMARGDGDAIGPRSDVYLLGACLHHILTGRPRHDATSVYAAVHKAFHSKPVEYAAAVPPELAAIANRACHRDPAERLATAEDFRQALVAFLEHDGSRQLARVATARLERLQAALENEDVDAAEVHHLAIEARFGFQQALKQWPDNGTAASGVRACIVALADLELRRDNVEAAQQLLEELHDPPAPLLARLKALQEKRAQVAADLSELDRRRDATDMQLHLATRRRVLVATGAALAISVLVLGILHRQNIWRIGYASLIAFMVVFGLGIGALVYVARGPGSNETLTRLRITVLMVTAAQIGLLAGAMRFDLPWAPALAMAMLVNTVGAFAIAIISDRRYLGTATVYAMTFVAVLVFPDQAWLCIGIGTLLAVGAAARALARPLP